MNKISSNQVISSNVIPHHHFIHHEHYNVFFQEHKQGEAAFYWLYFLLGILIPLLMLAFCNANLIKALRESMKMRQLHSNNKARSVNVEIGRKTKFLQVHDFPKFLHLGYVPCSLQHFSIQVPHHSEYPRRKFSVYSVKLIFPKYDLVLKCPFPKIVEPLVIWQTTFYDHPWRCLCLWVDKFLLKSIITP